MCHTQTLQLEYIYNIKSYIKTNTDGHTAQPDNLNINSTLKNL